VNAPSVRSLFSALGFAALAAAAQSAAAVEWSDTSISWRYGSDFAEPFINTPTGGRVDIAKNIFALTHADGYKYGTNFFNVDMLLSDNKDPASCANFICTGSAQEAYVVYRGALSLNKISGKNYGNSLVRDWEGKFGFDWNTKDDAGYNSKKRMFVLGPQMSMNVPGFLNIAVLGLWESNAPCTTFPVAPGTSSCTPRYDYKTHAALDLSWGIPFGASGFNFQGYFLQIASKGRNEFGGPTKAETHFDGAVMYDLGALMGGPKQAFKVGLEYEWWRNKFGNDYKGPAGQGAFAKTPMIRSEYHF